MAKQLQFDVTALDKASQTFTRMAAAVERFEKRLDRLDGKRVEAEVDVDTKKAEAEVGRFATDTRRKLEAALSNLPELDITADSSDADRKLAEIRAQMSELADKTIGVDISAEDAIAEAKGLQRELEKLAREAPDIQVRVDAAAAAAKLAEVDAEVKRLDGRTATIKVKKDKSFSDATVDIALLARSLQSLAIPVGIVGAAPAIASLGRSAQIASGSLLLIPAAATAGGLALGTLVAAFKGFGDAVGDDPKKAAEAMAKLAPAARQAATAVNGLKPALSGIRREIQQTFFAGLGEQISALGTQYLPIVGDATQRVAEHFNGAATSVAGFLRESTTVATVKGTFSDLENVIENLAPALKPLTSVFVDLSAVGASVLKDISAGAEGAATSFAAFISRARESGQLAGWMRNGVDVLRQLGQVAASAGSILNSTFKASAAAGTDLLGSLVQVTGRVREFMSSAQGQAAMVGAFESINRLIAALTPGLEAAGRAIAQIITNREASGALESLAAAFSQLVVAAAPVVVSISNLASRAIGPLATVLGALAPVIGPVVGGMLALKAASAALSFVGTVTGLSTMRSALTGVLGSLRSTSGAMTSAGSTAAAAASGIGTAGSAAGAATGRFAGIKAAAAGFGAALPAISLGVIAFVAATEKLTLSTSDAVTAINQGGAAADAARQKIAEQSGALDDNSAALTGVNTAVNDWIGNLTGLWATTDSVTEAQRRQADAVSKVADETARASGISRSSYDAMKASTDAADASTQKFKTNLGLIGPAMAGIKNGVVPTTEMGNALRTTADSARDAATQSGLTAAKLGGVGAGAEAATRSMQASRDAFIQTATGAGMTEKAAGELATKLGLVPAKVRTDFENNAAVTALQIAQVRDRIAAVPVGKTITMNALTAPARTALDSLGVTVKTLPNGQVQVTANTAAAKANLDLFLRGAQEHRTEVVIDGQTMPARNALSNVLAQIAAGHGMVNIDGNSYPAQQVLGYLLGTVSGTNAQIQIGANKVPAEQVVNALMDAIRTKSPTVNIQGNRVPIDQVLAAVSASAGTPVTKPINADGGPAAGAVANLNALIAVPGMKPIGATTTGAEGAVSNLNSLITAPATKPIGGNNTGGLSANELLNQAIQAPTLKPIGGNNTGGLSANELLNSAVQAPAVKPMGGNNTGGLSANELLAGAVQQPATKPMGGNNAGGMGANSALTGAVQTQAVKPMGGNNAGGMGANQSLVGAVQAPATKPINANDSGARGVVNGFIGWVSGLVATVSVVAHKIGFSEGGIAPQARGSIVPMAAGGGNGVPKEWNGHRLNPMNTTAQVVRPQTYRVVGDRAQGDEAYIPLVPSSGRSRAILAEANRRMGLVAIPAGSAVGMAEGGMVTAARAILGRMNAHQQLFEDWTWRGAPAVVGQYNDDLLNARDRAGMQSAGQRFLEDYVRRNTAVSAPRAVTAAAPRAAVRAQVQAAQVAKAAAPQITVAGIAELRSILAEERAHNAHLLGLRGDLLTSAGWGPELVEELRGLANGLRRDVSATARAAAARDLSAMGAW